MPTEPKPTPYHVWEAFRVVKIAPEGYDEQVDRTHYGGGAICEMDDWDGEQHGTKQAHEVALATAKFIVRACNSHADLLAAVKVAYEFFINPGKFNPLDVERMYLAAIAKAEKE